MIYQILKGKFMVHIGKSAVDMFIMAVLVEILEKYSESVLKLSVKGILYTVVVNPAQRLNIISSNEIKAIQKEQKQRSSDALVQII